MQYKNNVGPKWVLRVLVYLLILLILPIMVGAKGTVAFARILEYTDNEYNYSFQFPSNWKTQKVTSSPVPVISGIRGKKLNEKTGTGEAVALSGDG